ncbi:IclR family transcriptional regulator [soil metagenome]
MSKIVNRTLDFFEAFAEQRKPLSLTELVKVLDIPLSSCHDVVHALEERGYLYEVKQRGGYYPTARLFDIAKAIVESDPVSLRAAPVLEQLSSSLNASASLARARGTTVTYLAVSLPADPLRFSVSVGSNARNLYATSVGKAFLASLPPAERKAVVDGLTLTPLTKATITSKAKLLKDIEESQARGYFINREESVDDALTFSTRFSWSGSTYILTVAGTLKRMERQQEAAAKALLAAAQELGQRE